MAVGGPSGRNGSPGEAGDPEPSIPLSALEHVAYCERQAALIHIEATWSDSVDTVRGDLAHRAVDLPGIRRCRELTTIKALPVHSSRHGLHGVCDLVEITGMAALPVEYKIGPYRPGGPADLQIAGQAICLAEAGYQVPAGCLYSAADRRRHEIPITADLISRTLTAAARNDRRCRRCSLRDDCLPEITCTSRHPVDLFIAQPMGNWRD
jgi:CRISPR-associated exonuclease Cas4